MRLILLTLSILLLFQNTLAQSEKPVTIAEFIGASANHVEEQGLSSGYKGNRITSYQVGVTAQFKLISILGFRTGAIYNQRYNSVSVPSNVSTNMILNYTYVDLPAHLVATIGNVSVFAGVAAGFKTGGAPSGGGLMNPIVSDKSNIYPVQYGIGYVIQKRFEIQLISEASTLISSIQPAQLPGMPTLDINASSYGIRFGFINF